MAAVGSCLWLLFSSLTLPLSPETKCKLWIVGSPMYKPYDEASRGLDGQSHKETNNSSNVGNSTTHNAWNDLNNCLQNHIHVPNVMVFLEMCFGNQPNAGVNPGAGAFPQPRPTTPWMSSRHPPEPTKPWKPITGKITFYFTYCRKILTQVT